MMQICRQYTWASFRFRSYSSDNEVCSLQLKSAGTESIGQRQDRCNISLRRWLHILLPQKHDRLEAKPWRCRDTHTGWEPETRYALLEQLDICRITRILIRCVGYLHFHWKAQQSLQWLKEKKITLIGFIARACSDCAVNCNTLILSLDCF